MSIGQPACPGGTLYTIRPGDTLSALAARFGVTVEAIVAANPGIEPRNLQIGQVICITGAPVLCPGGISYAVQPGDSFFLIAQRYGVSLQALLAANPAADPNRLQIGQVICIPRPPVPGPSPLCCSTLELVGQIPLSQLFPGGVALIKPAATATDAVSVTFAATSLPPPSVFGDFDAYLGQVIIPAPTATAAPTLHAVILAPVQHEAQVTWSGTLVVPEQIPSTSTLEIRVIKTAIGRGGIQILRNLRAVCPVG